MNIILGLILVFNSSIADISETTIYPSKPVTGVYAQQPLHVLSYNDTHLQLTLTTTEINHTQETAIYTTSTHAEIQHATRHPITITKVNSKPYWKYLLISSTLIAILAYLSKRFLFSHN